MTSVPPLSERPSGGLSRPPRVCLSTVDPSGDAIGAALAEALQRQGPIELYGVGGPAMREAGVTLLRETTGWSALGVVGWIYVMAEVLPRALGVPRRIAAVEPDLFVPIDSAGFNVPVARALRRIRRQPVLYYFPSRAWSRGWRLGRLAQVADYVAAPFPWNAEGDDGTGRVRFVGHPAADLPGRLPERGEARRRLGLDPQALTLGLLPGSRRLEVRIHLPLLLETAARLRAQFPGLQVVASRAATVRDEEWREVVRRSGQPEVPVASGAAMVLRASDVALVCLGTASLEGCVLACPMVTFYRGTRLQGFEYLLKPPRTTFCAMPNILAGEQVITELIQRAVTVDALTTEAARLLGDATARERMAARLAAIARQLGGPGAADRAAEAVCAALAGEWRPQREAGVAGVGS